MVGYCYQNFSSIMFMLVLASKCIGTSLYTVMSIDCDQSKTMENLLNILFCMTTNVAQLEELVHVLSLHLGKLQISASLAKGPGQIWPLYVVVTWCFPETLMLPASPRQLSVLHLHGVNRFDRGDSLFHCEVTASIHVLIRKYCCNDSSLWMWLFLLSAP